MSVNPQVLYCIVSSLTLPKLHLALFQICCHNGNFDDSCKTSGNTNQLSGLNSERISCMEKRFSVAVTGGPSQLLSKHTLVDIQWTSAARVR